ncbi:dTDP-3-amino-3,6-dideoxy-alpha-D-galactopyranose transaminase [Polystyrenella longa]|uniref:dTDP-3-amino-3,6-dideoxy-alpha-D-galactopyranose transaminase n=1 Tax=Polystyrenella longa TaxID=2528007 RepID=A0A518CGP5_9PLAN|nr:DegT/DnrJ/EryC1/StrS aminotransferase family protein [Polystyrenella longa]QDU78393.1 dTDP-3-amino-3,6-dideoxy-alpha-D-galactopyranose transaminase [Polystyrenella longa]
MPASLSPASLAMNGGTPVRSTPFAPWPSFDQEMMDAVQTVLASGKVNYWTGQEGRTFEKEFANSVGAEYGVLVANGTLALELALKALEIQPGDEVITTCRTFVATASSVMMCGAKPIFADVDPISHNITAETIAKQITPRTKAIIAVHLAGWACDMDPILELAREHNLYVIEDCAQCHGATYKGKPLGTLGDIGAFSFCQDKIMTCGGEGGMVVTNNAEWHERAWGFKDHGKNWDAVYRRKHETVFKWLHEDMGTNWRMTEMQAAIGRVALQRLPDWIETRRKHAAILDAGFEQTPGLQVLKPGVDFGHSYYKYYALLKPNVLPEDWTRDQFVAALQAEGIPCGSGACPEIYFEKVFEKQDLKPAERLPVAAEIGQRSLMFMVHPTLSEADMQDIVAAVGKVMQAITSEAANQNAA